jgi:predicted small lipoprotein YifL
LKKQIVWVVAVILLAGLTACDRGERQKGPEITTPYAAVMLDNGQLFYGKLVNAGSSFPELTDVYYIQSQVNQETKAVTSVLTPRRNDVHGPDRMFLNQRHVVLIEPVGTTSKVAQLIEADKQGKH